MTSSPLSSPPTQFSSPPPPQLSSPSVTPTIWRRRLLTSIGMAVHTPNLEHHVSRYVILLFTFYFSLQTWNLVTQFYTYAGKWPDLVLEIFLHRPGRRRDGIFVPRVFVEFKSASNSDDAIKQLIQSISMEYGPELSSKGFLIGVKGTQWTIMDYHLVIRQGTAQPLCFIRNFYDPKNADADGVQPERPTPSKQYENFDFMDWKWENDAIDLHNALEWISQMGSPRDLTFMGRHVRPLPVSLTVSTLRSLGGEDQDQDQDIEELGEEFAHLIPLLRGELSELVETMDTDH